MLPNEPSSSSSPSSSDTDPASSADVNARPVSIHRNLRHPAFYLPDGSNTNILRSTSAMRINKRLMSSQHDETSKLNSHFETSFFDRRRINGQALSNNRDAVADIAENEPNEEGQQKTFSPYIRDLHNSSPSNDPHDEEETRASPTTSFASNVRDISHIGISNRRSSPRLYTRHKTSSRVAAEPTATFTPYVRDNQRVPTRRLVTRVPSVDEATSHFNALDTTFRRTSSIAGIRRRATAAALAAREDDASNDTSSLCDIPDATLRRTMTRRGIPTETTAVRGDDTNDASSVCEVPEATLTRTTTESRVGSRTEGNTSFHARSSSRLTGTTSFTRGNSTTTLRRTRPSILLGSRRNTLESSVAQQAPLLNAPVPLPRRGSLERLPPRMPRHSAARDIRQGADSVKAQLSCMFGGADEENMPMLRRASVCAISQQQSTQKSMRPRLSGLRNRPLGNSSSFSLRRRRQQETEENDFVEFPSNRSLHRTFSESASVRSTVVGR